MDRKNDEGMMKMMKMMRNDEGKISKDGETLDER